MNKGFFLLVFMFLIISISCVNEGNNLDNNWNVDNPNDDNPDNTFRTLIIPLYSENQNAWDIVINLDLKDIFAVINPNNGVGSSISLFYQQVIYDLVQNNKIPIGYVPTNYGNRNINDVKKEIDDWLNMYPNIQGFFIDEVSDNISDYPYYEELYFYIKSLGDFYIVLNVGAYPSEEYFDIADNIVVYEGTPVYLDYSVCNKHPEKSSIIVYGTDEATMTDIIDNTSCKYLFITDDILPNPYDTLPSYIKSEEIYLKY